MKLKLLWLCCSLFVYFFGLSAQASEKPNILFIMVDDLGKEWLQMYDGMGYQGKGVSTPNLTQMAQQGLRFNNVYSMPKCTPTRATLLSGQYPWHHGWGNHWDVPRWGRGVNFDPASYVTFAKIMKSAGYKTAAAGKWQINDFRIKKDAMQQHGFDESLMWTGFESDNQKLSQKRYWDPYLHSHKDGSKTYEGQYSADIFADFIIDFMARNKEQPMMIYYPMVLTHSPFKPPPGYKPKPKNEQFADMIAYTDKTVGRLLAAISTLGLQENTYIIFTTDNGSPGTKAKMRDGTTVKGGKGKLSENGMNAPFLVIGPDVPKGSVSNALVDFTDMLPTFAELGGASLPADLLVDGTSIVPLLHGEAQPKPRQWIAATGEYKVNIRDSKSKPWLPSKWHQRVVRNLRYKLYFNHDRKTIKLFDLQQDRYEQNNLLNAPLDAPATQAKAELEAAMKTMPAIDWPRRFNPNPEQSWDIDKKAARKKNKISLNNT